MSIADGDVPARTPTRYVMPARLALGLMQGIALATLWDPPKTSWAPDGGKLHAALLMVACYVPLIPLAGLGHMRLAPLIAWTLAAAALLAPLTVYDIWRQLPPDAESNVAPMPSAALVLVAAALLFVLHHLIEAADLERRWRPSYAAFVAGSWRHAFQLPMSLAFAGVMWGITALGAQLFDAAGLKAVAAALRSPALIFPVAGVAFAFAVDLTDVRPMLIDGVRRIALTLGAWLLPVAVALVTVFLLALIVAGLGPLGAARGSTRSLLGAVAALVVFINAAYQDGTEPELVPTAIRWSGQLGAILMLPLVALAGWALTVRSQQYGLSPDRVQAAILCAVAAVYACGYSIAALSRGIWMRRIESVNFGAAVAAVIVMLLVLSPVADPARLATRSQLAGLATGTIAPEKFDFSALQFNMARYGRMALAQVAGSSDPKIARLAQTAQHQSYYGEDKPLAGTAFARAVVRPAGVALPPGFREQAWSARDMRYGPAACLVADDPCILDVVDLRGDGVTEVMATNETNGNAFVFMRDPTGAWAKAGELYLWPHEEDRVAIAAGRFEPIPSLLPDLKVGEHRLHFTIDYSFEQLMGPKTPAGPSRR